MGWYTNLKFAVITYFCWFVGLFYSYVFFWPLFALLLHIQTFLPTCKNGPHRPWDISLPSANQTCVSQDKWKVATQQTVNFHESRGRLIMQYRIQQAGDSSSDEWLHSALNPVAVSQSAEYDEGTPLPSPHSSSNEDQRRGYQALNQPQVHFTYVLMNLRSCAEPLWAQGIAPPMPYQHSSEDTVNKTAWAIADRRRLDTHGQHIGVWSCDIRRGGGGLFMRSWSHAVICLEACWTLSCCSGVNLRLSELGIFVHVIDSRVFW